MGDELYRKATERVEELLVKQKERQAEGALADAAATPTVGQLALGEDAGEQDSLKLARRLQLAENGRAARLESEEQASLALAAELQRVDELQHAKQKGGTEDRWQQIVDGLIVVRDHLSDEPQYQPDQPALRTFLDFEEQARRAKFSQDYALLGQGLTVEDAFAENRAAQGQLTADAPETRGSMGYIKVGTPVDPFTCLRITVDTATAQTVISSAAMELHYKSALAKLEPTEGYTFKDARQGLALPAVGSVNLCFMIAEHSFWTRAIVLEGLSEDVILGTSGIVDGKLSIRAAQGKVVLAAGEGHCVEAQLWCEPSWLDITSHGTPTPLITIHPNEPLADEPYCALDIEQALEGVAGGETEFRRTAAAHQLPAASLGAPKNFCLDAAVHAASLLGYRGTWDSMRFHGSRDITTNRIADAELIEQLKAIRRSAGVHTDGKLYYPDIVKLLSYRGLRMCMIYVSGVRGQVRAALVGPEVEDTDSDPKHFVVLVAHGHAELLYLYPPSEVMCVARQLGVSFADALVQMCRRGHGIHPLGLVDRGAADDYAWEFTGNFPCRFAPRVHEMALPEADRFTRKLPEQAPPGIEQGEWTAFVRTVRGGGLYRLGRPDPDNVFWSELDQEHGRQLLPVGAEEESDDEGYAAQSYSDYKPAPRGRGAPGSRAYSDASSQHTSGAPRFREPTPRAPASGGRVEKGLSPVRFGGLGHSARDQELMDPFRSALGSGAAGAALPMERHVEGLRTAEQIHSMRRGVCESSVRQRRALPEGDRWAAFGRTRQVGRAPSRGLSSVVSRSDREVRDESAPWHPPEPPGGAGVETGTRASAPPPVPTAASTLTVALLVSLATPLGYTQGNSMRVETDDETAQWLEAVARGLPPELLQTDDLLRAFRATSRPLEHDADADAASEALELVAEEVLAQYSGVFDGGGALGGGAAYALLNRPLPSAAEIIHVGRADVTPELPYGYLAAIRITVMPVAPTPAYFNLLAHVGREGVYVSQRKLAMAIMQQRSGIPLLDRFTQEIWSLLLARPYPMEDVPHFVNVDGRLQRSGPEHGEPSRGERDLSYHQRHRPKLRDYGAAQVANTLPEPRGKFIGWCYAILMILHVDANSQVLDFLIGESAPCRTLAVAVTDKFRKSPHKIQDVTAAAAGRLHQKGLSEGLARIEQAHPAVLMLGNHPVPPEGYSPSVRVEATNMFCEVLTLLRAAACGLSSSALLRHEMRALSEFTPTSEKSTDKMIMAEVATVVIGLERVHGPVTFGDACRKLLLGFWPRLERFLTTEGVYRLHSYQNKYVENAAAARRIDLDHFKLLQGDRFGGGSTLRLELIESAEEATPLTECGHLPEFFISLNDALITPVTAEVIRKNATPEALALLDTIRDDNPHTVEMMMLLNGGMRNAPPPDRRVTFASEEPRAPDKGMMVTSVSPPAPPSSTQADEMSRQLSKLSASLESVEAKLGKEAETNEVFRKDLAAKTGSFVETLRRDDAARGAINHALLDNMRQYGPDLRHANNAGVTAGGRPSGMHLLGQEFMSPPMPLDDVHDSDLAQSPWYMLGGTVNNPTLQAMPHLSPQHESSHGLYYATRASGNQRFDPRAPPPQTPPRNMGQAAGGPPGGGRPYGDAPRTPAVPSGQRGAAERDPESGKPIPYSSFDPTPWEDVPQYVRDKLKLTESLWGQMIKAKKLPCGYCAGRHWTPWCPGIFALTEAALVKWGEYRRKAVAEKFRLANDQMAQPQTIQQLLLDGAWDRDEGVRLLEGATIETGLHHQETDLDVFKAKIDLIEQRCLACSPSAQKREE
jgi:hypothetical protein